MSAHRRYSSRALPSYRYVPGKTPHPVRDATGHSYGREPEPIRLDETAWKSCGDYLFAIDLFNAGYYWESHEVFEAIWNGAGRSGPIASFSKGVIQVAAALLKHSMGDCASAAALAKRGAAKLHEGPPRFLGVDAHRLADDACAYVAGDTDADPVIPLAMT